MPEAGVEEVEDGVFGAADVQIHHCRLLIVDCRLLIARPVGLGFFGDEAVAVMRVAVAQVVPAGAGPLGHGVGFADGAVGQLDPVAGLAEQGLGGAGRLVVVERRGEQRQFGIRYGVVLAVLPSQREGLAPVALAGEQPVAELVLDAALAFACFFQPVDDLGLGFGGGETIEEARVDGGAWIGVALPIGIAGRLDHLEDRQLELLRELEVPLVVRRDGHDRAGAVAHHHVIGDPHGDLLAVDRVGGEGAGEDSGLVLVHVAALHVGFGGAGFDVGFDGFLLLRGGDFRDVGMLRREHHVGGTEKGVGTGGEDGDRVAIDLEIHLRAFAAADPVLLQELDAFRPVERVEFVDQSLGVFRDPQHPLAQRAAFDDVALAPPLFHFLVGEDGAEVGRPVDGGFVDEGEADGVDLLAGPAFRFEFGDGLRLAGFLVEVRRIQLQEDPLGPADVFGIGGGDLAVPVVAEAEGFQLALEGGDVGDGGDRRMLAGLDRVLLRGQAEGVPAHRVEDVVALAALGAADDVGGGVALRVADVEAGTGGVGEHVEDEELRAGGIEVRIARVRGAEGLLGIPAGLPGGLEGAEGKGLADVGHGESPAARGAELGGRG